MKKATMLMRHDLNEIYNMAQAGKRASREALRRWSIMLKKTHTDE